MLNRRSLLLTSAAAGAAAALPRLAFAADAPSGDPALARLFDQLFQEGLRLRPEAATQIGLDKGANADLKGKLGDESAAGRAAVKAQVNDQLQRLKAVDRSKLDASDRLNLDTIVYTRESQVALQRFDFGGNSFGPSTPAACPSA